MKELSPSILTVKKEDLATSLKTTEDNGIKYLHFDVMDGIFVPNTSYSAKDLEEIKPLHTMINDVHLMIVDVKNHLDSFIDAGADIITFHYEAVDSEEEIFELIKIIKEKNCQVGISIKPKTDVKVLDKFLPLIDLVLIMSVEPGFGGQKFMESSLDKISYLRKVIDENNYKVIIEVDGGINDETIKLVAQAGIDLIVAGSYIYNKNTIEEQIKKLKESLSE